jgi:septal ring factor EnvC (AmiA/AmiB activator)
VLTDDSPHTKEFRRLLQRIRKEVHSLKDEIAELEKENSQLKSELREFKEGQADIFSEVSESERLAVRHQVLGLISKIDNHLEDKE